MVTSKAPSENLEKLEKRGLKIIVLDQGTEEGDGSGDREGRGDRRGREGSREDN